MIIKSFPPIIGKNSKILILGTMPGEMSLKLNQYYGHGGNHFWKILFELFEVPFSKNYDERMELAKENSIAIWDVLKACVREGSSDSAIEEEVPNDFERLFIENPRISHIFFNGKKAHAYFDQYVSRCDIENQIVLPSTSSANTWKTFEEKLQEWKRVKW